MAQREFPCPQCRAVILVPDDYFQAAIACAYCAAVVDRRTGRPMNPVGAGPYQAPAFPGNAALPPGVAPYQGYNALQPPKRKSTGLIVAIIVGAIVLPVAGVLALAAIPLFVEKENATKEEWVKHVDTIGGFEALFPRAPRKATEQIDTPLGKRTFHRARCIAYRMHFEASYFDLSAAATYRSMSTTMKTPRGAWRSSPTARSSPKLRSRSRVTQPAGPCCQQAANCSTQW